MLKDIVDKKHYLFTDKAGSWQEAIKLSCRPLEEDGTVEPSYAEEIIRCVEEYGPYIVIMPEVAMPHSQEGLVGVNNTAVSFMKVEEPISFDVNDPEKNVRLFFTFASCDHETHLKNMGKLAEMLVNEELVAELIKARTAEDLLKIYEKYGE